MTQPLKSEIKEDVLMQTAAVYRIFRATCLKQNIDESKFIVKTKKISEAALRTLRRAEFYSKYHKPRMSEVKQGAVLAFWILKYRPFCSKIINDEYVSEHINEYVAINIMFHNIVRTYQESNINETLIITHRGYKQLIYRLKNWDLSKEGLMTLADILYYYDGSAIDDIGTAESMFGKV